MIGLLTARRYAGQIIEALAPWCERLEIAGSVRRGRPAVNDLDFVVWPGPDGLMGFRERASRMTTVVKSGEDIYIVRTKDGLQVDFYFTRRPSADLLAPIPGNWGTVLLCRTGSKEHNIYLARRAQELGLKWETMRGLTRDGRVIASETEEDIFRALDLPFIKPEERER